MSLVESQGFSMDKIMTPILQRFIFINLSCIDGYTMLKKGAAINSTSFRSMVNMDKN